MSLGRGWEWRVSLVTVLARRTGLLEGRVEVDGVGDMRIGNRWMWRGIFWGWGWPYTPGGCKYQNSRGHRGSVNDNFARSSYENESQNVKSTSA